MIPNAPLLLPLGPLLALIALVAGCARDAEAAQRDRLMAWFAVGETVEFAARSDCAAGLYRLVNGRVKAALPVVDDPGEMRRALAQRGQAALRRAGQSPDQMMVDMANAERPIGMAMRRAGLEARPCMGQATQGAFRHLLETPDAVLAWDAERGALILMDPGSGLLMVAMGSA
jgi:hypothetical protein